MRGLGGGTIWKVIAGGAIVAVLAFVLASFWSRPQSTLAHLSGWQPTDPSAAQSYAARVVVGPSDAGMVVSLGPGIGGQQPITSPQSAPPIPPAGYTGSNDEDTPQGRPIDLTRDDWIITQTNAQHWANEGLGGLDLAFRQNSLGTPLHATMRGLVGTLKDRGNGTGYGNAVYINGYVDPRSGLSYNTLYGHFQKIYVSGGQAVSRGDVLGEMGSTGWSTGPHVHYEVWRCQMTPEEVQKGIAPGTVNHSHTECVSIDPQPYI